MRILAIVPSHKNNTGLPGKDTRVCAGKPVIAWTLKAATQSRLLTDVLVISDSEQAQIEANKYGVLFVREPPLVAASTSSLKARIYAYNWYADKYAVPDIVVTLLPIAPLRTAYDIDKAIELFLVDPKADSVISVYSCPAARWAVEPDNSGYIHNITRKTWKLRQDVAPTYVPNGAIYVGKTALFLRNSGEYYPGVVLPYIMPGNRSIDIDSLFDLEQADWFLSKEKRMDNDLVHFDNLHCNCRGWLISPGPSLADITTDQWRMIDRDITFGVSHAVAYHDARYLVVGEVETLDKFPCFAQSRAEYKFVTEGPAIKTSFPSIRFPHWNHITRSLGEGLMYGNKCGTAHPALNLALIMGCNPIVLLGVDYGPKNHVLPVGGEDITKNYGEKPDGSNPGKETYKLFADHASALGRTIINANPESRLNCFMKQPLEEILNGQTHG